MSGDPFKKVNTGDSLRIPAAAYNAFIDAALASRVAQLSGRAGAVVGEPVLIENNSGVDRNRFDVLGISGAVFDPSDSDALSQFKNRIVLTGITPTSSYRGKFAILQEPVKAGKIARAVIIGPSVVTIDMQDSGHNFADVKTSDATKLQSGTEGSARILYKESGTGDKWAVVRMGGIGHHELLDGSVHGDTQDQSVVDGDVIIGDLAAPNTKWTRFSAPGGEDEYLHQCSVDGSGVPTHSWISKSSVMGSGIEGAVCHRIKIPDGSGSGTYTISSDDWRGRALCCWLQAVYSSTPSTAQWGGGATSGITRFFGSAYSGSDRTLMSGSGGTPAVKLAGGSGNLKWAWAANTTGNDCHAVCLVQATPARTSPDHTV